MKYASLTKEELLNVKKDLDSKYAELKEKNLKLDMSRGKPSKLQLDISVDMMNVLDSHTLLADETGFDLRNYGILDGIPEAKRLFADLLSVSDDEIFVGGNSSLNMMYDTIQRAMQFGLYGSKAPWNKLEKIKFICPAPGYDRHFAICELFGIEMITVAMKEDGPDMDAIEKLVAEDEAIKGAWCVPLYSNPQGVCYSDETVKRFANLKPKAKDFRLFWDNAYFVHHIYETTPLLNIFDECKKVGSEDMVFEFISTSKITFSGAGVAAMAASKNNLDYLKKLVNIQTIGSDKINQFRHVKYFKDAKGVYDHMKKHADVIRPKFDAVINVLKAELDELDLVKYTTPKGGYFVSVDTQEGCAKRTVEICKELGVTLTPAGVTYPYGKDPKDSNIRIAPTLPPVEELLEAMEIFCLAVKLATVEKCLAE